MFLLLILYAAYTDYTRREIPNSIILYIYVSSLASNNLIFERITGFLIPALPLFFIALKYDGIQGGDVKFLSAVGAYLGLFNLALVLIPTTVTAVVWSYVRSEKSVPLATVFCIGYIIFKIIIFLKGG